MNTHTPFEEHASKLNQTTNRAKPTIERHDPTVVCAPVRRGRPVGSNKERIAIRIDQSALAKFRALGPGWQTRINEVLVKAAAGL